MAGRGVRDPGSPYVFRSALLTNKLVRDRVPGIMDPREEKQQHRGSDA